ncbi:hypothetical protein [Leptotrichia sp. oral taxon 223]|uniref:hypothetical protein n=1 Tax=Leptotrichia sp. oral taxon 223 TaxID=712363 RepID=UPI0015B7F7E2|nr:hypothetical protein [Leptotrichia sp. oral taxon 223]NWO20305.1 hypothetical protein [Leptotrichia sp. oral taxon 223]
MNLKKQMLVSAFAILAIMSCGKKDEAQNEDQDEIQIEQQSADTATNNSQDNPQEAQPVVESSETINENANNQPLSQVKPEEIKTSKTLQHVDKLIGKEIPMEDRILVFSKENNQYKITYKGESENGMQTDTKNLTFNEKNDSLTDGTYTFKLNKNKLGLYAGNQFIFTVD